MEENTERGCGDEIEASLCIRVDAGVMAGKDKSDCGDEIEVYLMHKGCSNIWRQTLDELW